MSRLALSSDGPPKGDSGKTRLKLALAVLSLSVAGLAAVYQAVYPLSLVNGTGYLFQIPPVFWVFVVSALVALFFTAVLTESSLVTLGSIVATALVLNFHYFLIYGVNGRDMRGEVSRLFFSLGNSHLGIDLYSYFQWPVHFVLLQQIDRVISLSLVDTIWTVYLAYYVLFGCAVGVVTYSFTDGDGVPWIAAAVFYVVFTRQWLNNQLVPQFLALVVLLFLFAIHESDDTRIRTLRAALYLVLVLTHPFFFSFYVLYVLVLPFARAAVETLEQVGTADRPSYYQTFEALRHPLQTVMALQHSLRRRLDLGWMGYVTFLTVSYLLFLYFRFTIFKRRLFVLLSGPKTEASSTKIPSRMMELIFGTSQFGADQGATVGELPEVLLYELTSRAIKNIVLSGTVGLLAALFLVSAIALLLKPSSRISPSGIAVVLSGIVYYVGGFVLPLIGTRAFQVMTLPLGSFLEGSHDHGRYVRAIVLVILVASPIVVANFMVNYSLTAGGNTHDLHADEAGQFVLRYSVLEDDTVITYPAAGYPPDITKTGEELPVTTLEGFIATGGNSSGTIVYGERQEYLATHFDHRCNFSPERRNAVYDNRIRVLKRSPISEPLSCSER